MTVNELMERLAGMPGDMQVAVSYDNRATFFEVKECEQSGKWNRVVLHRVERAQVNNNKKGMDQ